MIRIFAPAAAALCLSGCAFEPAGPVRHDYRVIERDAALPEGHTLDVNLRMGVGNLRIGSGTEKLARADFEYNIPSWKPELWYGNGELRISQPGNHGAHPGNTRYQWDVRLNRDVPLNLNTSFGAGEAQLDLGAMTLRRVEVQMGVGKLRMDLRGQPKQDYDVRIHGGVGEATVYLPSDVNVDADAHGGIGQISAPGLSHEGSHYYSPADRKSKVTIHLEIRGGVGEIRLIAD